MIWLAACSGPHVEDVRATCTMDPAAPLGAWWSADRSGPETIDAACAEALGGVLRLDWSSFHAEPRAFGEPETALEAVLWGAYLLVASDLGSADALEGALLPTELLWQEYSGHLRRAGPAPARTATEVWVGHYQDHVTSLSWSERDGCYMRFDARSDSKGDVLVCSDALLDPVIVASSLLHEAGHAEGVAHTVERYGFMVDDGPWGTFGLQTRWGASWFDAYRGLHASGGAENSFLFMQCAVFMVDVEGFPPCEGYGG